MDLGVVLLIDKLMQAWLKEKEEAENAEKRPAPVSERDGPLRAGVSGEVPCRPKP